MLLPSSPFSTLDVGLAEALRLPRRDPRVRPRFFFLRFLPLPSSLSPSAKISMRGSGAGTAYTFLLLVAFASARAFVTANARRYSLTSYGRNNSSPYPSPVRTNNRGSMGSLMDAGACTPSTDSPASENLIAGSVLLATKPGGVDGCCCVEVGLMERRSGQSTTKKGQKAMHRRAGELSGATLDMAHTCWFLLFRSVTVL